MDSMQQSFKNHLKPSKELTETNILKDLTQIQNNTRYSLILNSLVEFSNSFKEIFFHPENQHIQFLQTQEVNLFQLAQNDSELSLIQDTILEIKRMITQSTHLQSYHKQKEEDLKGSLTTNETSEGEEDDVHQQQQLHNHKHHSHNHHNDSFDQFCEKSPPFFRSSSTSDLEYQSSHPQELSWHLEHTDPCHHSDDEFIPTSSSSSSLLTPSALPSSSSHFRPPLVRSSTDSCEENEERDHCREICEEEEDRGSDEEKYQSERGKRNKRLNKSATVRLTQWLVDHLDKPFPSPEEKSVIASSLNLTPQQVGNWMTNMRKRHVYPILSGKKRPKTNLDYTILDRQHQNNLLKQSQKKEQQTQHKPSAVSISSQTRSQTLNQQQQQMQMIHNQKERRDSTPYSIQCLSASSSSSSLQDMDRGFNNNSAASSTTSLTPPTMSWDCQHRHTPQLRHPDHPQHHHHKHHHCPQQQQQTPPERNKRRRSDDEYEMEVNDVKRMVQHTSSTSTSSHRKRNSSEDWQELLQALSSSIEPLSEGTNGENRCNEGRTVKKDAPLLSGEELKELGWLDEEDVWYV